MVPIVPWWHSPIIIALCSGLGVAVLSAILNRYVIRPKYCTMQEEKCLKTFQYSFSKMEVDFDKEIAQVKSVLEKHKELSHEIFSRKDVIGPQMKDVCRQLRYVRNRLDQLAVDRNLPPVVVIDDGDEDDSNGF